MRRRRVLTLTGGTVSIALAGCLGDDDGEETDNAGEDEPTADDDDTADNGDDEGEDKDEEVEPELEGIIVELDESTIDVGSSATVTVLAQYDDGSVEDVTDQATISTDDDSIATVDNGTVTGNADGTITISAEYEGFEETIELTAEKEDDEDAEPFELGGSFEAEGTGGYISFAEESEADAEDEGLAFPTEEDDGEAIVVEATVDGETWESTTVEFPDIDTGTAEASIEATEGLSGDIDLDNGLMTTEGTLEVTIDDDDSFEFEIAATSEESGELRGAVDAEFTPAEVTVVDNEFIVDDETGNVLIDGFLGLPADEPGENWLSLTFELESE